jgi:hypothetical protein
MANDGNCEPKEGPRGKRLTRSGWNLLIDLLALLLMLGLVVTGLVIGLVLPAGSGGRGGGGGLELWGWGRHDWGDLHAWLSAFLGGVVLLHLVLHWRWVCKQTPRLLGLRPEAAGAQQARNARIVGCGLLAVLVLGLVAFVGLARDSVVAAAGRGQPRTPHTASGDQPAGGARRELHGAMTLSQAARASGLALAEVKSRLGLPADTTAAERLGRLRRRLGLNMHQIRRALGVAGPPEELAP